jgi:hypothetical protein
MNLYFMCRFFLVILIFSKCLIAHSQTINSSLREKFTISGSIIDSSSKETIIGASVYIQGTNHGVQTNEYGLFSLTLEAGNYTVIISSFGYKTQTLHINLNKNITVSRELPEEIFEMEEVSITSDDNEEKERIHGTQMSSISIPIEKIKNVPTIGGETDVMKVMQLMPGVKRGGEGQNTLLVRGGSGDGNLILLDEAVVYNASHLFGFFSIFNNDAIKDANLMKGGFPSQYGGRLSSVMDLRMKDGNMQKYNLEGGIGLLSSHLTFQGPIIKNRLSFIISARRSYIDKVFKLTGNNLPYYFYDATFKINYSLSDKTRFFLSTYYGNDILNAEKAKAESLLDGGFSLGNMTTTFRWNQVINDQIFSNLSIIFTRFRYKVEASLPDNSFYAKSKISDIGLKYDLNHYLNKNSKLRYGFLFTNHFYNPNVVNTTGAIAEEVKARKGNIIYTQEFALYSHHEQNLSSRLKLSYGIRLPMLLTEKTFYINPEPRFSASYSINEKQSIKASYSRMHQYVHLVSNSSIALPSDLWYPVTEKIKPLQSDQVALGYNYLLEKVKTTISAETYYKKMKNLIDYKEGSVLVLNDDYEKELTTGKGDAYGVELFAQKTSGKFNGWIGYTLSWSIRQFDALNQEKMFYAKFDRRHDFSIVGNYEFTKRISASAVWVYSTGQRFTPITGYYLMPSPSNTQVDNLPIYGNRNSTILPSAHRLDISVIIKRKPQRKREGEWHFGAYNTYNHAQPYKIVTTQTTDGGYKYQAKGLFGCIPFIGYHFKY